MWELGVGDDELRSTHLGCVPDEHAIVGTAPAQQGVVEEVDGRRGVELHGRFDVEVGAAVVANAVLERCLLLPPEQEVDVADGRGLKQLLEGLFSFFGAGAPALQAKPDDIDRLGTGVIGAVSGLLGQLIDKGIGLVLVDNTVGTAHLGELLREGGAHRVTSRRVPVADQVEKNELGSGRAVQEGERSVEQDGVAWAGAEQRQVAADVGREVDREWCGTDADASAEHRLAGVERR